MDDQLRELLQRLLETRPITLLVIVIFIGRALRGIFGSLSKKPSNTNKPRPKPVLTREQRQALLRARPPRQPQAAMRQRPAKKRVVPRAVSEVHELYRGDLNQLASSQKPPHVYTDILPLNDGPFTSLEETVDENFDEAHLYEEPIAPHLSVVHLPKMPTRRLKSHQTLRSAFADRKAVGEALALSAALSPRPTLGRQHSR